MTNVKILRGQHMKVGDTLPELRAKLVEANDGFNLSDYSVTMSMRRANEKETKIDSADVTIESELNGTVTFKWEQNHTDKEGTYLIEFVAKNNSAEEEEISFPNSGYGKIFIEDRL